MQTVVKIEDVQDLEASKKILQGVLDRDWSNETLRQTANVAANAIYWRDEQIKELNRRIALFEDEAARKASSLWSEYVQKANYPEMFGGYPEQSILPDRIDIRYRPEKTPHTHWISWTDSKNVYTEKPLVFGKEDNVPCTAEIEVAFEKLASYFEKRAKENARRSEKEDNVAVSSLNFQKSNFQKSVQADRSSYYFSGKADSYKRAAEKVREILGK